MQTERLIEKVKNLSPEKLIEVEDFAPTSDVGGGSAG